MPRRVASVCAIIGRDSKVIGWNGNETIHDTVAVPLAWIKLDLAYEPNDRFSEPIRARARPRPACVRVRIPDKFSTPTPPLRCFPRQ